MRATRKVALALWLSAVCLLQAADSSEPTAAEHQRRARSPSSRILNHGYIPLNDCTAIKDADQLVETGLYHIYPGDEEGEFTTLCNMDLLQSNGWTVIQKRVNDSWSFQRTWEEYRNGFGEFSTNFWLGLYKISRITDMGDYELYIGIEDFEGSSWFALYSGFYLSSEDTNFKLMIGPYSSTSTAGDALSAHDMQPFSTPDHHSGDKSREVHCAEEFKGGWWYHGSDCFDSNLNGVWYDASTDPSSVPDRITWNMLPDDKLIRSTIMALRRL